MRWMWIDRVIEFEPQTRLVAIKNVSLAEEHLHDHFSAADGLEARPVFPASLIIEGMAQAAGVLVGAANDFREKVILAKIMLVELDCEVMPGQSLRYEAKIERLDQAGAVTKGIVSRCVPGEEQWQEIGRIELLFSHVDQSMTGVDVPEHNFVFGENLKIIMAGVLDRSAPATGI